MACSYWRWFPWMRRHDCFGDLPRGAGAHGPTQKARVKPFTNISLEPDVDVDQRKPRNEVGSTFSDSRQSYDRAHSRSDDERSARQRHQYRPQILHLGIEIIAAIGGVTAIAMSAQVDADRIASGVGK